ncbi:hypothetical protein H0X06_03415 [Candidatus Dependentiae bacterium]|nr:hypothetical protein [Candidatus Dependentiae bacterium]
MWAHCLFVQNIVEQGLIFSFIITALYLTSRVIKFDDLTIEGSFGIGGALTTWCLINGWHWSTAFVAALMGGACTGLITGLLNTRLGLNNLISGIVTTTGLFSINLVIAGAHAALGTIPTIFSRVPSMHWIVLVPLTALLLITVRWLLTTEIGFLFTAIGDNPHMLTNLGKSASTVKIAVLMLANAITAFGGSLYVQHFGYFSIWANVGILIVGFAGLILAEAFGKGFGISIVIGGLLYQAIIALTFECEIDQSWNKLITALLIVFLIVIKNTVQFRGSKEKSC